MGNRKRLRKLLALAVAGCALLLMTGVGSPRGAGAAQGKQEVCAECHDEVVKDFERSFHGRPWAATGKNAGCQSCHGSPDKHKADQTKKTIITFGKESLQSAEEKNARCLSCHDTTSTVVNWEMSRHHTGDVACTSCHTIHAVRNIVVEPDTCVGCHKSVRIQISKQSHHPIIEGKVKCSDCHNPHGTPLSHAMIKADNINQLCYKCHADKRGPFLWEHPPVEENCTICHAPHGSQHNRLMVESIPNLCQDCHDWSRHPGTEYSGMAGFVPATRSNRFFARGCLNCHSLIHGSTMPVSPGSTNTYGSGKAFTR